MCVIRSLSVQNEECTTKMVGCASESHLVLIVPTYTAVSVNIESRLFRRQIKWSIFHAEYHSYANLYNLRKLYCGLDGIQIVAVSSV